MLSTVHILSLCILLGAEIENMVNQAALQAVLDGTECVKLEHLEYARDKAIMGPYGGCGAIGYGS